MNAHRLRAALVLGLCMPALTACSQVNSASVNVLGVNYTEREFSYRLEDPANPKNETGGELIDSFSAGGIHCCYALPRFWHPGIKVKIFITQWDLPPPPNDDLKNLKEVRRSVEVEVPRYADRTAGDLWVVQNADSSFSVISSNYQSNHPKWPGAAKGWPVPSLAYKRAIWDQQIKQQAGVVRLYETLLSDLQKDRLKETKDAWDFKLEWARNHDLKIESELHAKFSGPADPRFTEWLTKEYEKSLENSQAQMKSLLASKP